MTTLLLDVLWEANYVKMYQYVKWGELGYKDNKSWSWMLNVYYYYVNCHATIPADNIIKCNQTAS